MHMCMCIFVHIQMYSYIYIYIYILRESERETEGQTEGISGLVGGWKFRRARSTTSLQVVRPSYRLDVGTQSPNQLTNPPCPLF